MTATSADVPAPLTRFVGRERELDDLARLLPATRLLTLTGAGGSGKTRLARETAQRVGGDFERVSWVDLTPLADATLIDDRIATALRIPERTGGAPLDAVIGAIGDSRTLLVVDNCEHLVDACATVAETLLQTCPHLVVLATSREALGVMSETAWLVPAMSPTEAVQLFVDRAQSSLPSFTLTEANRPAVEEICRRLDGIPLAIEFAAARVRVLPPEQIARRLDDAFRLLSSGNRTAMPRHRTLRATMEWSHALLGAREQALLRRLSVFAGSFSLDAAEAVCEGTMLEADDILDGIAALVDKSLLVLVTSEGEARYRLLETVRQYGLERLAEADEQARFAHRHAEYFLSLLEGPGLHVYEGELSATQLARLAEEDDNLRAAMAWAIAEPSRAEHALRLADGLFWYWYGSSMAFPGGQYREGRRFVEAALTNGHEQDRVLRANALSSLGLIALASGAWDLSARCLAEALDIARATHNRAHETFAVAKLGATHFMRGNIGEARRLLAEAQALIAGRSPSVLHAFVYFWDSWLAIVTGDLQRAREVATMQIGLGHQTRHHSVRGHSNTIMGMLETAEGRLDEAYTHYITAITHHLDPEDAWGLMLDVEGLARLAVARRRHSDAARILGGSDALRERAMIVSPPMAHEQLERLVALLEEKLGAEAVARLRAEGRTLPLSEIVQIACDQTLGHTTEFAVVVPELMAAPPAPAPEAATPAPASAKPAALAAAHEPITSSEPARLRVLTLGPLQTFVGARLIEASTWGSARPRELLVYLLLHPQGRTKEQAGLALWPDASAAQLRNNFHVTLHRLRKALGGSEWIALDGERYRLDAALLEEFDATRFEHEVTQARRALKRKQEGATQALDQALALYRGDFLDGEPVGDWHVEYRDRLQILYLDGLMELGQQYLQEERHRRAAEAFRRVLARDEFHESALQSLLRCHAALGERAQGVRVYRSFVERLRQELETEPEPQTARVFEQLLQGADASV